MSTQPLDTTKTIARIKEAADSLDNTFIIYAPEIFDWHSSQQNIRAEDQLKDLTINISKTADQLARPVLPLAQKRLEEVRQSAKSLYDQEALDLEARIYNARLLEMQSGITSLKNHIEEIKSLLNSPEGKSLPEKVIARINTNVQTIEDGMLSLNEPQPKEKGNKVKGLAQRHAKMNAMQAEYDQQVKQLSRSEQEELNRLNREYKEMQKLDEALEEREQRRNQAQR